MAQVPSFNANAGVSSSCPPSSLPVFLKLLLLMSVKNQKKVFPVIHFRTLYCRIIQLAETGRMFHNVQCHYKKKSTLSPRNCLYTSNLQRFEGNLC